MNTKKIVSNTYDSICKQYFDEYLNDLNDEKFYLFFANLLNNKGLILDLGCGYGKVSKWFKEKGFKTIGYDISKNMINLGLNFDKSLNLHLADITKIPKQKVLADGAIYAYSLFHLNKKQAKKSLETLNTNLKNDGYVMLLLQKGQGERIVQEPFDPQKQMYVKFYDENEILKLLEETEYKVIKITCQKINEPNALSNEVIMVIAKK